MPEMGTSAIEKLLKIKFESSPQESRVALPPTPRNHPQKDPYTKNGFLLTPKIARDWLTYRVIRRDITSKDLLHEDFRDNRRFLIDYVRHWGKILHGDSGEKYNPGNHVGLAFSPDGFMLDGQHRTAGVLLSGVPIKIPVTKNVSWSAFDVMDKGRRRNPTQMLGNLGSPVLVTGIARCLLPIVDGTELENYKITGRDHDVIDLALGWPLFRGPWIGDIIATQKFSLPKPPLGAAVFGALAAGADPFEVQEFLNGLKPKYRGGYPIIGKSGEDPRHLLKLAFMGTGKRGRHPEEEQRRHVGMMRRAMEVWLHRHDENPIELKMLPRIPAHRELPPVWGADQIRKFHAEHVS